MLKVRINKEALEALSEDEQKHYKEDSRKAGEFVLDTDQASNAEKALRTERKMREESDRLLAQVVPAIVDSNAASGYTDREKWKDAVEQRSELLGELDGEEFNLEDVRKFKAEGKDKRTDSQLQQDLDAEKRKSSQLDRDLKKATSERDKAQGDSKAVRERLHKREQEVQLNEALDSIKVTNPRERRLARLLLKDRGLEVREEAGDDGPELHVYVKGEDGEQLLRDYAKSWAETEEGKEFVTAPVNSGGSADDVTDRDAKRPRKGSQNLEGKSPEELIAMGLGTK